VREHNEDAKEFVHFSRGDVLVVCDGMGGHACGDVASRIACDEIVSALFALRLDDPRLLVYRAIERAHAAVRDVAAQDESKRGMGTTCVVAYVRDGAAWLGHVGDSRAYLVRSGVVRQLTADQTKVQALVERGIITKEDARTHPDAGVLSQAVGQTREIKPYVTPEEGGLELWPGDVLMLCSDGAYDCLADADIVALTSGGEASQVASQIVKLATDRDGKDNATVAIARVRKQAAARRSPGQTLHDEELDVAIALQQPQAPVAPTIHDGSVRRADAEPPPKPQGLPTPVPELRASPVEDLRFPLPSEYLGAKAPAAPSGPPGKRLQGPRRRLPGESVSEVPEKVFAAWRWLHANQRRTLIFFFVLGAALMAGLAMIVARFGWLAAQAGDDVGRHEPNGSAPTMDIASAPPVVDAPIVQIQITGQTNGMTVDGGSFATDVPSGSPLSIVSAEQLAQKLGQALRSRIEKTGESELQKLKPCPKDIDEPLSEWQRRGKKPIVILDYLDGDKSPDKYARRTKAILGACDAKDAVVVVEETNARPSGSIVIVKPPAQ
jgi:protein phosphatase